MKYAIRKRILKVPSARTSRHWLKRIKIKGSDNLSLYKFFKIFLFNIQEDEIMDRANGVAYNFILAIFPTIIFLFTLIPYISTYFPTINQNAIMEFLADYMPASMYEVVSGTVLDILNIQRGGLLTFGFVFALYLATNGMMALMRAFNACYKTVESRGFFKMRLTATGLTIILAVVLLAAVVLLIVGEIVISRVTHELSDFSNLRLDRLSLFGLFVLRFLVIFIVFFFAVSFIYYFGPAVHYNWKFFSVGSFIATLACLGVSYGFSFYITNFGSYNKVYGSIGALIALMVWIQLLTVVLLFGYEINASLHYGQKVEAVERRRKVTRKEKSER
ncbi:MAG: YihY/virulence factor BrkB family protein, partial [Cyclobacteriaceae bacterium]|nr:YihY/virulence factor BrkB family protein [Cyclobacteriaceae bacterium]